MQTCKKQQPHWEAEIFYAEKRARWSLAEKWNVKLGDGPLVLRAARLMWSRESNVRRICKHDDKDHKCKTAYLELLQRVYDRFLFVEKGTCRQEWSAKDRCPAGMRQCKATFRLCESDAHPVHPVSPAPVVAEPKKNANMKEMKNREVVVAAKNMNGKESSSSSLPTCFGTRLETGLSVLSPLTTILSPGGLLDLGATVTQAASMLSNAQIIFTVLLYGKDAIFGEPDVTNWASPLLKSEEEKLLSEEHHESLAALQAKEEVADSCATGEVKTLENHHVRKSTKLFRKAIKKMVDEYGLLMQEGELEEILGKEIVRELWIDLKYFFAQQYLETLREGFYREFAELILIFGSKVAFLAALAATISAPWATAFFSSLWVGNMVYHKYEIPWCMENLSGRGSPKEAAMHFLESVSAQDREFIKKSVTKSSSASSSSPKSGTKLPPAEK